MGDEFRLLISARDAGAANNLAPVARLAAATPGIHLELVASAPAEQILRAAGLQPRAIEHDPKNLPDIAQSLLAELQPHALLVGLSGPDAGIDEALLAQAEVPSFALQDFWGDVNQGFGAYADTYLVRDALAARLTQARSGARTEITGSPTQALVPDALVQQRLARQLRQRLRVPARQPILLLCSQPLWRQAGYRETLIDTLQKLPDGLLLVRPHPRESAGERALLSRLLRRHCRTRWRFSQAPFPMLLAAADLVLSAFSNSGLERVQFNQRAPSSAGVPVYLLQQPRLRRLFRDWTGLSQHPLCTLGAAQGIERGGLLGPSLQGALRKAARQHCARAAGQLPGACSARDILILVSAAAKHKLS